jgi:hypothetical protein
MPKGLLETLAEHGVPPVPEELDERFHQRLNRALLAAHLVDFALGAVPCVAVYFLRAVWHLIGSTFTGRFESDRGDRSREAP